MSQVYLPGSIEELWPVLEAEPGAALYAGGTDLLVKLRSGMAKPPCLVCLERIEELKGVSEQGEVVRIGAGTTHAELLAGPLVARHFPVLRAALLQLGSPLIRNMGTIGGNICTASPAGDTLPPLYVLHAEVELASRQTVRRMPIRDFILGPGQTRLVAGEVLSAIRVEKPRWATVQHFEKVGCRNALACALVSLAALLRISADGVVERAALAWGSVGPGVVVSPEVEQALVGRELSPQNLMTAAAIARQAVCPITDVRAPADYRRLVAGNLLLRLGVNG